MLEVCSTTLPQMAIPEIYSSPEFLPHLKERNDKYKKRAGLATEILNNVTGIHVVEPGGGFFLTVVFQDGVLKDSMKLQITNKQASGYIQSLLENATNDRRFVLNLLASTGICVVPLSSFCCKRDGFRVTLLEEDPIIFESTFRKIATAISQYLNSI
jgi:aspartate/methionine/tyrosine aminotransferase